jgi:hypothetical protein
VAAGSGLPDEEIDRLYGLPLESFVSQRDALARRLRQEGDRDGAEVVKRMAKPTRAAWAANQAARSQPRARRELLAAGEELRRRQQRVLSGRGHRGGLRPAVQREQAAVGELVRAASGLLTENGRGLGAATLDRVRETLHAAAVDDEVRERLETGRIEREARAAGLGPLGAPSESTGPKGRGPKPRARAEERRKAQDVQRRAERAAAAAREKARAADRALRDATRDVQRAGRAEAAARRRAEAAAEEAERGAAELEAAKQRVRELKRSGD